MLGFFPVSGAPLSGSPVTNFIIRGNSNVIIEILSSGAGKVFVDGNGNVSIIIESNGTAVRTFVGKNLQASVDSKWVSGRTNRQRMQAEVLGPSSIKGSTQRQQITALVQVKNVKADKV